MQYPALAALRPMIPRTPKGPPTKSPSELIAQTITGSLPLTPLFSGTGLLGTESSMPVTPSIHIAPATVTGLPETEPAPRSSETIYTVLWCDSKAAQSRQLLPSGVCAPCESPLHMQDIRIHGFSTSCHRQCQGALVCAGACFHLLLLQAAH